MNEKKLKVLRKKYQLSQKELSAKSNIALSRVSQIEHDFNDITLRELKLIAKVFNTEIANLLL